MTKKKETITPISVDLTATDFDKLAEKFKDVRSLFRFCFKTQETLEKEAVVPSFPSKEYWKMMLDSYEKQKEKNLS